MLCWRIILSKRATLTELETTWSIDDILRANAFMDMEDYFAEVERNKPKP